MRKYLIYLISTFFVVCSEIQAQDGVPYSQFYLGTGRYHPALGGVDPFLDLNFGYKQPWQGFGDNASAFYLSAFAQIKKGTKLDEGMRTFRISNPTVYNRLKQVKKIRRKHGVGLVISADKLGAFKNLETKVFYAYHIPVTREFNLSMGSGIGLYQQQVDFTNLHVRDKINDQFYNRLVSQSNDTYFRFLMDFSVAFYSEDLYFALTGKSLVDKSLGGNDFILSLAKNPEISFLSGIKFDVGPKFAFHPNIGLAYNQLLGFRYLAGLRVKYNEVIYAGGSMDDDFRISYLMGLKAINNIYIHYSYDIYRGNISEFAQGTHEITLSFRFLNKYGTSLVSW